MAWHAGRQNRAEILSLRNADGSWTKYANTCHGEAMKMLLKMDEIALDRWSLRDQRRTL